MKQYLLSIYQPDGDPPPPEILDPIVEGLNKLNDEMRAKGVWVFHAGMHPASTATVVRAGGLLTDGPFTEGKEHLGGFSVINAEDLDGALVWAGRMAEIIAPLPIEVRPIQ
jgi:hypothetical protein